VRAEIVRRPDVARRVLTALIIAEDGVRSRRRSSLGASTASYARDVRRGVARRHDPRNARVVAEDDAWVGATVRAHCGAARRAAEVRRRTLALFALEPPARSSMRADTGSSRPRSGRDRAHRAR
jgi:hypothetical protein